MRFSFQKFHSYRDSFLFKKWIHFNNFAARVCIDARSFNTTDSFLVKINFLVHLFFSEISSSKRWNGFSFPQNKYPSEFIHSFLILCWSIIFVIQIKICSLASFITLLPSVADINCVRANQTSVKFTVHFNPFQNKVIRFRIVLEFYLHGLNFMAPYKACHWTWDKTFYY